MRRFILLSLAIVSMVLFVGIVSQAQSGPFLTHHLRDATSNGQAPSVGRLPAAAEEAAPRGKAQAMAGEILAKPYRKDDLARAVRDALKTPAYH